MQVSKEGQFGNPGINLMETQQFQEVKKQRGEGEPELHCIFPVISNTNLTRRACLLATLVFILIHMC